MTTLQIIPSKTKVAASRGDLVYFTAKVTVPDAAPTKRKPISVCLLIDNSGSMGEYVGTGSGVYDRHGRYNNESTKMERAKLGAQKLADALGPEDTIAVVTFESYARTVVSPTKVTESNRKTIQHAISAIGPMGGTNLSAGLDTIDALNMAAFDRILLFSDGQINEGRGAFCGGDINFFKNRLRNTSVATFGIGNSYNDDLMSALALNGGQAHYLDSAEKIPEAIGAEFGALSTKALTNVKLEVSFPAAHFSDMKALTVLDHAGPGIFHKGLYSLTLKLPDLLAGQTYQVAFEATAKKKSKKLEHPIYIGGQLTAAHADAGLGGGSTTMNTFPTFIAFGNVKDADKEHDKDVLSVVALQTSLIAQAAAERLAEQDNMTAAREALAQWIAKYGDFDAAVKATVEEILAKGYQSKQQYADAGSRITKSYRSAVVTSRGGADMYLTSGAAVQKRMMLGTESIGAARMAFSITADKSGDDMPDVHDMVTK